MTRPATIRSATGPEAQRLVKFITEHPNERLSLDFIAAGTGLDTQYISGFLRHRVAKNSQGERPAIHLHRPLASLRRLGRSVYYLDTKGTKTPVEESSKSSPVVLPGDLMEVVKVFPDSGRCILTDENGRIFAGTLAWVDV
jgi:hypothetical protein